MFSGGELDKAFHAMVNGLILIGVAIGVVGGGLILVVIPWLWRHLSIAWR